MSDRTAGWLQRYFLDKTVFCLVRFVLRLNTDSHLNVTRERHTSEIMHGSKGSKTFCINKYNINMLHIYKKKTIQTSLL